MQHCLFHFLCSVWIVELTEPCVTGQRGKILMFSSMILRNWLIDWYYLFSMNHQQTEKIWHKMKDKIK